VRDQWQERLAFIGLGALGAPMAINLIRAGLPLTLHNRSRGRESFVQQSARGAGDSGLDGPPDPGFEAGSAAPAAAGAVGRAASPAEAVAGATVVCLCLSHGAAVRAVLLGENTRAPAALPQLRPGSLVIDFSTIAPATSRAIAALLAERGVAYLDAPVTGGTEGARAGTLSVLVGGEPAQIERARPLLEVVGSRITHLGPVGAGQEAKAVNQVLVAGSYGAVAEAVALGQRLGLPMERVLEALKGGAAGSWALEHRSGNMLSGSFPLGFKLALHHKDLAIALAAAASAGLELPITERVAAIERELIAAGFGDEDVSVLARHYLPGAPAELRD